MLIPENEFNISNIEEYDLAKHLNIGRHGISKALKTGTSFKGFSFIFV